MGGGSSGLKDGRLRSYSTSQGRAMGADGLPHPRRDQVRDLRGEPNGVQKAAQEKSTQERDQASGHTR